MMNSVPRISPSRTVIASFAPEHASANGGPSTTTDFDDGIYVLHIASSSSSSSQQPPPHNPLISCALSDRTVNTYDAETLRLVHTVRRAHERTITDLCYHPQSGGGCNNVVVTSGQDGLVKLFDLRQSAGSAADNKAGSGSASARAAIEMTLPKNEEALSVSLGYDGSLAAVGGSRGLVHFFDLRGSIGAVTGGGGATTGTATPVNLLGTYEDAHTEEVTRVRFQPSPTGSGTTNLLVTSSEDGLAVVHDTSKPTEEAALTSVMNVGSPLRDVGFFGPAMEGIYCLTGSETLSVWHHDSAQRICDFGGNVRASLSQSAGFDVDYLVGCHWDGSILSLVAGNGGGDSAIFRVDAGSISPSHLLRGGHKSCVRSFAFPWSGSNNLLRHCLVTGGEDARLCEWNLNGLQVGVPASGQSGTSLNRNVAYASQPQTGGGPAKRVKQKKHSNAPY